MKRSEEEAKKLIESLLPMQENPSPDGHLFPCPRCGRDRMNCAAVRNSLSRRANVYICNECGMDEAMLDMAGMPPLPLNEWGMVIGFDEGDEDDEGEEFDEDDESEGD